jgi:hypothetical protein
VPEVIDLHKKFLYFLKNPPRNFCGAGSNPLGKGESHYRFCRNQIENQKQIEIQSFFFLGNA